MKVISSFRPCSETSGVPSSETRRSWQKSLRIVGVATALCLYAGFAVALSPVEQLVKDVSFNDAKSVKRSLAQGMDPNTVDKTGTPLLMIAAREKSDDVATLLLNDPKTNVDALD